MVTGIIDLARLGGFDVVENPHMEKTYIVSIERTLKQRLFSLPWRPFLKYDFHYKTKPLDEIYIDYELKLIVGHPEVIEKLKEFTDIEKANYN